MEAEEKMLFLFIPLAITVSYFLVGNLLEGIGLVTTAKFVVLSVIGIAMSIAGVIFLLGQGQKGEVSLYHGYPYIFGLCWTGVSLIGLL